MKASAPIRYTMSSTSIRALITSTGTDPGITVSKVASQIINAIHSGSPLPSDIYQLTVGYTITIENVGSIALNLGPAGGTSYGLQDLLPMGFCFVAGSATFKCSGLADPARNIPQGPKICPSSTDQQRLGWDFSELIPSGETRTLVYQMTALVPAGD